MMLDMQAGHVDALLGLLGFFIALQWHETKPPFGAACPRQSGGFVAAQIRAIDLCERASAVPATVLDGVQLCQIGMGEQAGGRWRRLDPRFRDDDVTPEIEAEWIQVKRHWPAGRRPQRPMKVQGLAPARCSAPDVIALCPPGCENGIMLDNHAEVLAGAGVVAQDHAGRVLLIQRSDDGHWGIPGGAVNAGETWTEAAARECLEETGWTVQIRGLLGIYSDPSTQIHRYPGGALVQFFGVVFLASPLWRDETSDGEASDVAWFALDKLPRPLLPADVPVLEDAARLAEIPFLH